MNIWLINQYALAPSQAGSTRHFSLSRELVRRGHHVTIVASSFDHGTRRETRLQPGEISRLEEVDGVSFLWLRTPPYTGNNLARIRNMLVFANRVWIGSALRQAERPDVILGSSPHLFGALAAALIARRRRVPFVLEIRDLWPQSLVELGNVAPGHPYIRVLELVELFLYRAATHIITLLPSAADHLVAKGAPRERITWLPNGVDLDAIPLSSPANSHPFTIMYAGAHGLANCLDTVIEAAAILERDGTRGLRFRLVGDGPDKPRLQDRVAAEQLQSVHFDPPVPRHDVFRLLQTADAFVLTMKDSSLYRWGTSPNKLFDYLAVGRPIVMSTNSPYDPVTEAGAGLTVPAEDPEALAGAIRELAALDPLERAAMGLRGRAYVERHHSLAQLSKGLESILEMVVAGRVRQKPAGGA